DGPRNMYPRTASSRVLRGPEANAAVSTTRVALQSEIEDLMLAGRVDVSSGVGVADVSLIIDVVAERARPTGNIKDILADLREGARVGRQSAREVLCEAGSCEVRR